MLSYQETLQALPAAFADPPGWEKHPMGLIHRFGVILAEHVFADPALAYETPEYQTSLMIHCQEPVPYLDDQGAIHMMQNPTQVAFLDFGRDEQRCGINLSFWKSLLSYYFTPEGRAKLDHIKTVAASYVLEKNPDLQGIIAVTEEGHVLDQRWNLLHRQDRLKRLLDPVPMVKVEKKPLQIHWARELWIHLPDSGHARLALASAKTSDLYEPLS